MSVTVYSGNLNPTAPAFLPANLYPTPFFIPTRIYHPLPPPLYPLHLPPFFPNFTGPLLPPPYHLPLTSITPTRAVMLLSVPGDVTESSIRRDLEVFGEVRGVQMEIVNEGIVTVHFYNLRDSQRALKEIRNKRHMQQEQAGSGGAGCYTAARGLISGRFVWAHFVFPQLTAVPQGNNQGSLVIMNLEPTVSSSTLRQIFQVYGEVKELRETPYKREQRFVEFYDVRDAALALREMDGKSIDGKPIVVQFSRPGGFSRKLFLASRFNKNFFFNHHFPPPPPALTYHHRRLPSSAGQFRRKGSMKVNTRRNQKQPYERQEKYINNTKRTKEHVNKNVSDGCFVINEDAIAGESSGCRDGRTTVMIKNIPNKYSQKLLLNLLDSHCNDCNQKIIDEGNNNTPMSSYDFVYLPIDFSNKCNVGYGFVNMTSPEAVWRLYKAFHNQQWGVFKSTKICEVTYARLQEHFKKSRGPGVEMEKYMPVLFSPPRDGRLLTEPIPVADLGAKPVSEDSCHSRDDRSVVSCSSDKTLEEGSDGERLEKTAAFRMTKA
ncbi:unnamed protein product [Arabis nemorensis]|uniref:RRM domain-containing protein n=1 Tax=Arabis nemorensis TaxID=586526 RepID=A0A565AYC9_9BRAS|nr:unnamed protein product [Arabis nemorensis]